MYFRGKTSVGQGPVFAGNVASELSVPTNSGYRVSALLWMAVYILSISNHFTTATTAITMTTTTTVIQ